MSADRICRAVDPRTGQALDPSYPIADLAAVRDACARADADFDAYRGMPMERRAALLEAIADNIVNLGPALLEQASAETGLPLGRLEGERGRTVGQLRFFAGMIRRGEVLDVRIDPAAPERQPLPKPDLRLQHIPVGPVAVFGASNFPLAFSVAGGDTASALAAGCPVVVKGHRAHPGTGALVAGAVEVAVEAMGAPRGAFAYLLGDTEAGGVLVADPRIKAVGFTGSRQGGLALQAIAAGRREPIPVFAEMSSVNPVVLAPEALKARAQTIAEGFVASLALGAGQFCTNPGIVLALAGPDLDRFVDIAAARIGVQASQVMLTPGIHRAYEDGVGALKGHPGATLVAEGQSGEGPHQGRVALFLTDAVQFMADSLLAGEVFGAAAIVVRCHSEAQMLQVLAGLEGQLTATLQIDPGDEPLARRLLPLLERKVGRILANGWPTGVEVSPAMVHGGPFPATSDSRSTSVGGLAIRRFLRPVCYQGLPAALLPVALRPA